MRVNVLKYIANTKTMNRFQNWAVKECPMKKNTSQTLTNYAKLQKIYPASFALFAGLVQGIFIYKSKDMPKERKIPLILNLANNDVIALVGGALLNKPADKFLEKMMERANVIYKDNPNKAIFINGMKTAVPFFVTAVLFKYIGPVLATPLADKCNRFLVKKGWVTYQEKK